MTMLMNKKQEIKNRIDLINKGEVPEGYKCCWGYFYPTDWSIKKLKDLFNKVKTKNTDNNTLPVLTNSATQGVILQDEYFDREIVNDDNADGYYIVEDGDFMYNPRISSNAPAGPINRNHLGLSGIASPLYTIFRAKKDENIAFIENYFYSNYWHRYMKSVSNQGARHDRLNLTDDDFMNMPIPQPSEKEQEKIAEILSCCDKVIELKEKLLKDIYKEKNYVLDNVLQNYQDRETVKLTDITDIITKGTTPSEFDINGEIKYIKIESISNNEINNEKCMYISKKINDTELLRSILKENDILFGIAGALGTCAIVKKINLPANTNQALAIIRINSDLADVNFVNIILRSKLMKRYIYLNNTGGAQPNLNLEQIGNFELPLPLLSKQKEISNIVDLIDKKICLLNKKLEQYKQLKKSLSQLLLTGIVRVNEV